MGRVTESPEQRVVAGRYRLRRLLGQGSMGTVWEAYDEMLHRPVAVKEVRLPPGIPRAEADELRERTLREARAIAVVSHPNVITLHDVAREGAEPFVVMEYIQARSLAELLREFGPMEVPQAATVGYAVAAGLAAAHQAGITHRDIKPGNVLVAGDGRVKLTDFGIARNVSEATMTRTGIMLGSPAYIAPEVAAGREVTPAADLWGLGATLFAAVEGRAPYDPDGPVLETLSAVIHGDVPAPTNAGPLADVITRLMVKNPEERMPLSEVRRMLHPLLPEPGTPLYPESPEEAPTKTVAPAPEPKPEPDPGPTPAPLALANDPGPLPFAPVAAPAKRKRRAPRAILVALLAFVLFCASSVGGFALARVIGGRPVLPPALDTPAAAQQSQPIGELVSTAGDASTLNGEQGGGFVVPVPSGWAKFVEQRVSKGLPNSTAVRFLSPDGTQQLTVERFPAYYPKYSINAYVSLLQTVAPSYRQVSRVDGPAGSGQEPGQVLTYRTSEPGSGSNRVTFARLVPSGIDLWVMAVTVPVDQEDSGRTKLFDEIARRFNVTG
jgi:tRNA A-37 threonylcarbamoyl transferase component Bud32